MIVVASQTGKICNFLLFVVLEFKHRTLTPSITELYPQPWQEPWLLWYLYMYLKSTHLSILFHLNFRILKQNNGKLAVNTKSTQNIWKAVTKNLTTVNLLELLD